MKSPTLQPYIRLAAAQQRGDDQAQHLEQMRQIPLEDRYVWRVASALKWAFMDFDSFSVTVDRMTLPAKELQKVIDLSQFRPLQFCLFLKALFGAEAMARIMTDAISEAGGQGGKKRPNDRPKTTVFRQPRASE